MTTDYDQPPALPSSGWETHLPLILLSLAFAVFLFAQVSATRAGGKSMQWQLGNIDKQIETVKANEKQADEINTKAEEPVKQANQIQEKYSQLLNDVCDLAKEDDDAKKVVQKWKIQRNQKADETKSDK